MSKIKHCVRVIGATLLLIGAAIWSGTPQSQVIAMNLRSDAGYSYHQLRPDNDGEFAIPARLHRQIVSYGSAEPPGTIIIDTPNTYLYFVLGGGKAIRYGIGIGREGFTWSGVKNIERKAGLDPARRDAATAAVSAALHGWRVWQSARGASHVSQRHDLSHSRY